MLIVMYRSDAVSLLPQSALSDICFQSVMKNKKLGVTGFLVEYEGTFIQILEGDPAVVDKLYDQIASDQRHSNVTLLLYEIIDNARSFDFWAMNYGPLNGDFFCNVEFKDSSHPDAFKICSYSPEFSFRVISRAYAYAHVMAEADPVIGSFVKGELIPLESFSPHRRSVEP